MRLLITLTLALATCACMHTVPVDPPGQDLQTRLVITTTALPKAIVGKNYSSQLQATGGRKPYSWKLTKGSLPKGLALAKTGLIAGVPMTKGTFPITVQVQDSGGNLAQVEVQ